MAEKEKKYFRLPTDPPVTTETTSGEKEENIWAMKLDEKGNEEFYIQGKTNIYEKIQAFKDETMIENILRKVTDTGDTSLLMQRNGSYIDITDMPKNIFDAHRQIEEARKIFNELPVNIRAKYDHNFDKYLADFGTENWFKNMNIKTAEAKKEEVKEEATSEQGN